MKKELIGIFVCILLVGMVLPVTGTIIDKIFLPPPNGDTLYVGGSGEGNYTCIQDAINDSVDGDTVFVYSGTYIEKIEIDESIDLIGEDKNTTIIDGNNIYYDDVINVAANYVKISGFTVKNAGISNAGIQIDKHSYNTIMDNIVKDCYTGIYLHKAYYNTIISNLVSNNTFGIFVFYSSYNTIKNNIITNNEDKGIRILGGYTNTIINNDVTKNKFEGIEIWGDYLTITNNKIINNEGRGLKISGPGNCREHINIIDNLISKNGLDGILITKWIRNCSFINNIIASNGNIGLNCDIPSYDPIFENNYITGNSFWNNKNYGIRLYIRLSDLTGNNFFYHNNFINNIRPNAYDNTDNEWDNGYTLGGNYWSDYTGKDNDGDGIGDIPYSINGGDNKDRYPLMVAWGSVNFPPDTPKILGQRRFKEGEGESFPYTIYSKDPNGDNVCYLINWSDGAQEWTGPYASGEEITINVNIPLEKGAYKIFKIKAKDSFGAESDWETLEISVPRTRTSFWLRFFDMFPILQRILEMIL